MLGRALPLKFLPADILCGQVDIDFGPVAKVVGNCPVDLFERQGR